MLSAYARELNLGSEVEIELQTPDALDPYSAFSEQLQATPKPTPQHVS
jgi:hypothetical protein